MNSGSCSPQVPSVSESGFSGNLSYAYPFEADVFRMAVELVECLYFRQPFLLTVFKQSRYPHQDSLDLPQVSGVAHLSPNQTFSLASFLLSLGLQRHRSESTQHFSTPGNVPCLSLRLLQEMQRPEGETSRCCLQTCVAAMKVVRKAGFVLAQFESSCLSRQQTAAGSHSERHVMVSR